MCVGKNNTHSVYRLLFSGLVWGKLWPVKAEGHGGVGSLLLSCLKGTPGSGGAVCY